MNSSTNNMFLDFNNICRLCLHEDSDLSPIFTENENSETAVSSLSSKILACVSIVVYAGDNMPSQICSKCVQQVDNWVKFKELCDSAHSLLQQCLTNMQNSSASNNEDAEKPIEHEPTSHKEKPTVVVVLKEELEEGSERQSDNRENSESDNEDYENNQKECKEANNVSKKVLLGKTCRQKKLITCKKKIKVKLKTDSVCESIVKISKWKAKYDKFQRKQYSCGFCDKVFSRFCDLLGHDRMEHENLPKDVTCAQCGKIFISEDRLKIHRSTYHSERQFACDVCGGKFLSKSSLRSHKKKHSGKWVCEVCGLYVSSNMALLEHMRRHTGEKPYICDSCGKSYATKVGLNSHTRIHTREHLFKCEVCGYSAANHSSIYMHKATHSMLKPCVCEVCGKAFKLQARLTEHRKIHFGDKAFVCEVCNMGFISKYQLTLHTRVHSGERPYACDLCDKRFARSDGLREHKRTHTGEKRYTCPHCIKPFSFRKALKNHKCPSQILVSDN